MNWSTPGVNKPTLVERLWAWIMLLLMVFMGSIVFIAAVLIHDARAAEVDLTRWQPPPPRIWQCNDIRVTETVLQPGIVHYDLGGTIWGGSQFTLNINNGDMFFNGRPCIILRG